MSDLTNWVPTPEAARKANRSTQCIRDWIKRYGIGRKVAGRWIVDPVGLNRILDGGLVYHERPDE